MMLLHFTSKLTKKNLVTSSLFERRNGTCCALLQYLITKKKFHSINKLFAHGQIFTLMV